MLPVNLPTGFRIKDKVICEDEPIGEGGFGYVFKAIKPEVENFYAVKVFFPKILQESRSQDDRDRIFQKVIKYFETEQMILIKCKHRNIVKIEDVGILTDASGNQFPYFIMEFIEDSIRGKDCPPDAAISRKYEVEEAIHLISQACDALDGLHQQGVIHRDIKPANLLLQDGVTVKVADFGIAKILEESGTVSSFTIIGTPHYAAPEQDSGEELSRASDIYSLAKTLYTMVTAEKPPKFQIKTLPGPAGEGERGKALLQVLESATETEPTARKYDSALEFKKDLQSILSAPLSIAEDADMTLPELEPRRKSASKPGRVPKKIFAPVMGLALILFVLAIGYTQFPAVRARLSSIWQKVPLSSEVQTAANPEQAEVLFQSGIDAFDREHWHQAYDYFHQAVQICPDSARYYMYLGLVSAELKKAKEAISAWQTVVAKQPDNMAHKITLGKIYAQFGQNDSALKIWQQVLAREPDNEMVKVLIKQLQDN